MTKNQRMHAFLQACVNLDIALSRMTHVPADLATWQASFDTVRDLHRRFDCLAEPGECAMDQLHVEPQDTDD